MGDGEYCLCQRRTRYGITKYKWFRSQLAHHIYTCCLTRFERESMRKEESNLFRWTVKIQEIVSKSIRCLQHSLRPFADPQSFHFCSDSTIIPR